MKKALVTVAAASLLSACGGLSKATSESVSAEAITQVTWQLSELNGQLLTLDTTPTLLIDGDRMGGVTTCNNYFGRAELSQDSISLEPMGMTEKYCMDGMETEQEIIDSFAMISQWQSDGEKLVLANSEGKVIMLWMKAE